MALAELLFPSLVRVGVVLSRLGDVEPLLASLIKAMVLLWIQLRVVNGDCTSRTLLTLYKRRGRSHSILANLVNNFEITYVSIEKS